MRGPDRPGVGRVARGRRLAPVRSPWSQTPVQEIANQRGDLSSVGLEREVSGVQQMDLGFGKVTSVGFCPGWSEDFVVTAPRHQSRRLVGAEVLLVGRVAVEIELVVPEQL